MRRPCPTDLSEAEWNYIEPHLPAPKGLGRPRVHDLREILKTPSSTSSRAAASGACFLTTFPGGHRLALLQTMAYRRHLGEDQPSHPPTTQGSLGQRSSAQRGRGGLPVCKEHRGGRRPAWLLSRRQEGQRPSKRHILVDTEGFVLRARVHSAKMMDYEGIKTLLHRAQERFPRLRHLWLGAGYRGEDKD